MPLVVRPGGEPANAQGVGMTLAKALTLLALTAFSACGSGGTHEAPMPTAPISPGMSISPTPTSPSSPTPPSPAPTGAVPIAWAVGSRQILRSDDGGLTWSVETGVQVNAVAFADRSNGWIVGAATTGGHLLHTTDGGEHWHDEISNLAAPSPLFVDVAVLDAQHAVAVGSENGFLQLQDFHRGPPVAVVTQDGGATWQRAPLGGADLNQLRDVALGSVCLTATGPGLATGTDVDTFVQTLVLLTHDSGNTWTDITSRLPAVPLARTACAGDTDLWFAGGSSTLLHSGDGGATWSDLSANLPADIAIGAVKFRDALVGWLAADDAVSGSGPRLVAFQTLDGGQHWQEHVLKDGVGELSLGLDFLGQRVIVVAEDLHPLSIPRSSFGLSFASTDGGETWAETVHPEPINALWDVTLVP